MGLITDHTMKLTTLPYGRTTLDCPASSAQILIETLENVFEYSHCKYIYKENYSSSTYFFNFFKNKYFFFWNPLKITFFFSLFNFRLETIKKITEYCINGFFTFKCKRWIIYRPLFFVFFKNTQFFFYFAELHLKLYCCTHSTTVLLWNDNFTFMISIKL